MSNKAPGLSGIQSEAGSGFDGPIRSYQKESDGGLFVPAFWLQSGTATWTLSRTGAGLWRQRRTAANGSSILVCDLSAAFSKIGADPALSPTPGAPGGGRSHDVRGFQLKSFDLIYAISTADLAAGITPSIQRATYANGVAPVVTNPGTFANMAALPKAQGANILANAPLDAEFLIEGNAADVVDTLELLVDDTGGGTSVVDVFGLMLYYDYNIL